MCKASARTDNSYQACSSDCSPSLHKRLIKQKSPQCFGTAVFVWKNFINFVTHSEHSTYSVNESGNKKPLERKKEVILWVADAIIPGSFSLFSSSSAAAIAATTTAVAAVATTISQTEAMTAAVAAVADNCDRNSVT